MYLDAIMLARPPHGLALASVTLPHGQSPLPNSQGIPQGLATAILRLGRTLSTMELVLH